MFEDNNSEDLFVGGSRRFREDPKFEEVVKELRGIQQKVDLLLFGSVFLRQPNGLAPGCFGTLFFYKCCVLKKCKKL